MALFRMPSLGADMEAGTLVEWLVGPGDRVKRGDVVAVVETQKGAIEIECFEEGVVQDLQAELGRELPVGAPLALILAEGEAAPEPEPLPEAAPGQESAETPVPEPILESALSITEPVAPPAAPPSIPATMPTPASPPPDGRPAASPAARVLATERGVALGSLKGSGPGGAILLADVEAATGTVAPPRPTSATSPMDDMRKAIAAAMTRAKQTIPHFYLSETIDVQPAVDWLARANEGRPPSERLLLGALFVRATVLAASRVKPMNGQYVDGAFRPSEQVNAGVAVALRGGGLVAPALIGAERMDVAATMAGMRDLVTRSRAGRLRSSEMTEGTITISSLGETGAEAMTGVIFPPQVALVGIGAPHVRPWVVEGAVVPRSVVVVTVSADHRVSDGRQVARFLSEFETLIASPESL